jgi:hypothetical protein
MKTWNELTTQEISEKLTRSEADIAAGRVYSQMVKTTIAMAKMA